VEAAAQQGKYEQMYSKMFQTQPQWSGKQESQASLFRSYAQDLGLDMDAYDSAVTDDKTKVRVKEDITDGTGLGVKDAPTFFLNDKMLKLDSKEQFGRELAQFSAK
jgi:predicted DsbA family dithiol-disulfide isomerase